MTSFSRVNLQPAYVIHQRPYRDTSAIVEIFSEAHGRHALVAKGLKRPKSRLKGLIQPFQPLLILIILVAQRRLAILITVG